MLRLWFCPSTPRLKDRLAEFFIGFSNWIYGWARYRISLQRVILYFTRCLHSRWVTCSPLMNVRANMFLLHLCTLASWFSQSTPWGCRWGSSWQRGGDDCSVWAPDGKIIERWTTWWDPRRYGLSMVEENRTSRRLLSLSWRGRSVTRWSYFWNGSPSYPDTSRAKSDRSDWSSNQRLEP